jgi:hypothetical protein
MKVANDASGATLTVNFRDGIPNYRVSARGDTLVILIAPPGALERPVAKRDDKSEKALKHGSHQRISDEPYDH